MTGTAHVSVHVAATQEVVFQYLTDPARHVLWMGDEAELDPVPGGTYSLRMKDGFAAAGAFLRVDEPREVVFTWGFAGEEAASHTKNEHREAATASAMPAGSTLVTVTLAPEEDGTRLTLRHEDLPSPELTQGHQIAWETYLDRLVIHAAGGDPGPDPHS
jgi:uncharacterized protein YndB with AHSA1/START domain